MWYVLAIDPDHGNLSLIRQFAIRANAEDFANELTTNAPVVGLSITAHILRLVATHNPDGTVTASR